jgi:four helix bundle protein
MGILLNICPGTSLAMFSRMHIESSFRSLKVWQAAMTLVEDVYRVTRTFPLQERFGLTSQLRRTAVSVPSNIGEGKRRKRDKARAHHLDIALGSQGELEVQLEIAKRVGFLKEADYERLQQQTQEVGRMLNGLISSVQRQSDD